MYTLSRRSLISHSAAGAVAATLGSRIGLAQATERKFFVLFVVRGGLDNTYLFDARNPDLQAKDFHANYLKETPTMWEGSNGQRAAATSLVEPLRPFFDRFSIINGVVMAPSFDGHEQNMNTLFTGNPFGGPSFMSALAGGFAPLDYVELGAEHATITGGAGVALDPFSAGLLGKSLQQSAVAQPSQALESFLQQRYAKASTGKGLYAAAARVIHRDWQQMDRLATALRGIDATANAMSLDHDLKMMRQLFVTGTTEVVVIDIRPQIEDAFVDTHDRTSAEKSPAIVTEIVAQIRTSLEFMQGSELPDGRSLLDATTFMVASEFGRTLRQTYVPFAESGTDHNPLNNTILVGGAGVNCGQVFNGSDLQSADEVLVEAHQVMDSERNRPMGLPFDFATGRPEGGREGPKVFDPARYLTVGSVMNTLLAARGASWRMEIDRQKTPAPIIGTLMRS